MEALNHLERKKAFLNFLIFFSITAALIIATVFFSTEVPFKHNEQLREQIKIVEKEKDINKAFFQKMNTAKHLLDSLNNKDVKVDLLDRKIKEQLAAMDAMIDKNQFSDNAFYQNIVDNLYDLHNAKKDLRDVESKEASLRDIKQQVSELKAKVDLDKITEDNLRRDLREATAVQK